MYKINNNILQPIKYFCISLTLVCNTPLLAQETASSPQKTSASVTIEEVTVTAQMREESVQSVPIAIGVYDKDFITKIGAHSTADLEYAIPNINFGAGGRNSRGEIAIRGVGAYSRNIGNDARAVVYVDGVLTGRSSTFDQSLLDVERVEVLRGPQGTLSGANAIVGAINIITKTPTDIFSTELLSDVGNFNLRSTTGKINLPVSSDLYASLLLSSARQDGFIHNISNKDLQNTDRNTAKLKFHYLGIEDFTLDVGFDYFKDDIHSTNGEAFADLSIFKGFSLAPNPYEVAHDAAEFSKRELKGSTITANYFTEKNYQLTSITGIRKAEFSELSEEDYSPLDIATSLFDEESTQLTQEFRLVSPRDESTDYVVGIYFLDQDISTERGANLGANYPAAPKANTFVTTPASADAKSYSIYSNGNWRFTDNWEATGGVRYIHEIKEIDYSSQDTTGLFINVNNIRENKTYNELLPKIGLNLHITPELLIYSAISRGYRSGGWNADFLSTLENFQFNPEYAINYELGIKSTLFNDHVTLNADIFSTKFRDFQIFQFVTTTAGNTITSYTNAGKVTSQGVELDVNAKLYSDLSISFNAALTQAKFDEFKNGGGLGKDYDQNYLPFAPEHTYYLALDYQHTFANDLSLYMHIDCGYSGHYFSHPENLPANSIEHHYIVNNKLGLMIDDSWDISLWVKNLTNETDARQRSVSFLRVPRGYYNPPRFYGLTVKYNYH